MDDAEVIAAIAAGNLDGLATALDRYAASLFEYCHSIAPDVAVDAVHDTFIVAWSRLDGLRDPGRLYPWLQAVAANECFRRMLTDGASGADTEVPVPRYPLAATLPSALPGQVFSACADNTPAGRANRVSVTHRAGPFGRDGFPQADLLPRMWRGRFRTRPRAGTAIAVVVLVAAAAATTVLVTLPASNQRHDQAAAARPGSRASAGSPANGTGLPSTPAQPIPSSSVASSPGKAQPSESVPPGAMPPGEEADEPAAAQQASPPMVPLATMQPAPPTVAAQGLLAVDQPKLNFVSIRGQASVRTFTLTAENGPVAYTIAVPAKLPGSLTVWPMSGSLAAGASVTITATAATIVPFVTALTLHPGGGVIAVAVKANTSGGD